MSVRYMKKNDTRPPVRAALKKVDDSADPPILVAMDLSGASSVKFIMRRSGSAQAKVNADMTVLEAAEGTVQYDWQAGDTNTTGDYLCEVEVVDDEGGKWTFWDLRTLGKIVDEKKQTPPEPYVIRIFDDLG
jgi:hypothetical protein